MEAGGRVTRDAKTDDCMDAGDRVTRDAKTEDLSLAARSAAPNFQVVSCIAEGTRRVAERERCFWATFGETKFSGKYRIDALA